MSNPKDRVIILIDYGNIMHIFDDLDVEIDFGKLLKEISQNRNVIDTYMYMGVPYTIRPTKIGWFQKLKRKYNITVKFRYLKEDPSGKKKEKGIDVLLVVDMISLVYENVYDELILVSGDADYIPAIEKVLSLKKKVEIWSFKQSLSWQWKNKVGKENIYLMDKIVSKVKK